MRRHLQIIAICCALLLFGWSGVLAAALCAHARGADVATLLAGDSCCAMHAAQAADSATGHTEEAEEETGHCALMFETSAEHHAPASEQQQTREQYQVTLAQETFACGEDAGREQVSAPVLAESFAPASCAHCLGRSETPTVPAVPARIPDRTAKDADGLAPRAETSLALVASRFMPAVQPTRGAPPGHARRHVLLNIFLI